MNTKPIKIIYLTIDDSPSKDMKSKVDYLLDQQIPAIWYCRGEFMEKHLSSVIYAIERGFWIGNHSYSHPYFSQLSIEKCMQEIQRTEELIDQAYHLAHISRPFKLFRFPFGDKGGGKDFFKIYTNQEKEQVNALQSFLKKEGFQRADFAGITYTYYLKLDLNHYIDAPWTLDTKDYVVLSKISRDKFQLYTIEDFLKRMDIDQPEQGFGLHYPYSNDIAILHDFEQTTFLFQPLIHKMQTQQNSFQLPQVY